MSSPTWQWMRFDRTVFVRSKVVLGRLGQKHKTPRLSSWYCVLYCTVHCTGHCVLYTALTLCLFHRCCRTLTLCLYTLYCTLHDLHRCCRTQPRTIRSWHRRSTSSRYTAILYLHCLITFILSSYSVPAEATHGACTLINHCYTVCTLINHCYPLLLQCAGRGHTWRMYTD
jgi:hypothetical protein